jgi:hypothetical protein
MPSDDRVRLALDAFRGPIRAFASALVTTSDEVRRYLATCRFTWDGQVARVRAELGPLAAGRIDPERFAALASDHREAGPAAIAAVERALDALTDLTGRGELLCRVEVPEGGGLHDAVARALGEIGRAFAAARLARDVRTGRWPAGAEAAAVDALPFARWTRSERRLAPPLVVSVQGGALRPAGLSEFLDGHLKLVLVVEGECPPAPLARLVAPGTFVLQTHDGAGLDRLAAFEGPGVAALVPDSAARFVHDPGAGLAAYDRLRIERLPDRPPRRALGGLSAAQQVEELELLRSLATRPAGAEPRPAGAVAAAAPGGGPASADPTEKLAAWLLSRVDLSDLG